MDERTKETKGLGDAYVSLTGPVEYHLTNDYMFRAVMQKNEKVIRKEQDTELYQWALLFKANSWEELRMLAQKNEAIKECVYTMSQLSKDEKIRMQCQARKDSLAIEKGLYSRGYQQGQREGEIRGKVLAYADCDMVPELIAERLSISEDEVRAILFQKQEER